MNVNLRFKCGIKYLFLLIAILFLSLPGNLTSNDNKTESKKHIPIPLSIKPDKNLNIDLSVENGKKVTTEIDTTENKDKYIKIYESPPQHPDHHQVEVRLKDYSDVINISVYNLLGKKVLDVFRGEYNNPEGSTHYRIESGRLPNGVYICTVHGLNFRLTEKFVVSF